MARFTSDASTFLGYQRVSTDVEPQLKLFIGPREVWDEVPDLQRQGITHIVSVMPKDKVTCDDLGFHRLIIDAEDDPECDLRSQWSRACEFIDGALAMDSGVLIHCNAGQSRSGATLIAYIMHRLKQPFCECLVIVRKARGIVLPNEGFYAQLLMWERHLLGSVIIPGESLMHEIRSRLWLGSLEATQDWNALRTHSITYCVTCGRGLQMPLPDGVSRLPTLHLDDAEQTDVLEHLPTILDTIRCTLASCNGGILIHCSSGVSRSSSIVIAYIMREEVLTYADALQSVRNVCSAVQPNSGFARQLEWYQQNGCPSNLANSSGLYYAELPYFRGLLRRYSAEQVKKLVAQAGVLDSDVIGDRLAINRALDALDRLQTAMPLNAQAREEKRSQCRRLNAALENT